MSAWYWYVAYGSNMARARFDCYLSGGSPDGSDHVNPGCRDGTPARDSRAVWLPGRVYFAGESPWWRGGVAFYDHRTSGRTPARAWLITGEQLLDVVAQEMRRTPGDDIGIPVLADGEGHALGPGRYETVLRVGTLGQVPMLTFTAPSSIADVTHTMPSPAYLNMLAIGLAETHGWSPEECPAYLTGCRRP